MATPLAVGTGKLRVNGVQLPVADEMRIMPASEKREALMGLDGTLAAQISYQPCWIECSLRDSPEIDLTKLTIQTGVTVTVELANGTSYELSNAFFSGDGELEVKDGKVAARWSAQTIRRTL